MRWRPPFAIPTGGDFIKLKNGHLLLVYNDDMNRRTPLTVTVSVDNDKATPIDGHRRRRQHLAYPYAIQTRDEKIHHLYDE